MSKTKISWTEHTWNPIVGCSKVSPGCDNCYAESMAIRISNMSHGVGARYRKAIDGGIDRPAKWSGRTVFDGDILQKPINRKKPTMYFVCSMSDLFHEDTPDEWIDQVFGMILGCAVFENYNHTFQILTKRPERMREYLSADPVELMMRWALSVGLVCDGEDESLYSFLAYDPAGYAKKYIPLPNVWLGVTAENQEQADKRIPILQNTPAAVGFVSVEPMLGPIDLAYACFNGADSFGTMPGIDWVICGCESGPQRRPMNPHWSAELMIQCKDAGVPFFMKQMQDYSGKVLKDIEQFPKWLQVREFPKEAGR